MKTYLNGPNEIPYFLTARDFKSVSHNLNIFAFSKIGHPEAELGI